MKDRNFLILKLFRKRRDSVFVTLFALTRVNTKIILKERKRKRESFLSPSVLLLLPPLKLPTLSFLTAIAVGRSNFLII